MAYPALQVAPNNVGSNFLNGVQVGQDVRQRNMLMQHQMQLQQRDEQFRNILAQSVGPMAADAAQPPSAQPQGQQDPQAPQGPPSVDQGFSNYLAQNTGNPLGPSPQQMQQLMQLDPERAAQMQQVFQQQREQQRQQLVQHATERVNAAQFVLQSKHPKRTLELGFPDVLANLKDHGVDVDSLDDDGVREVANHVIEQLGPIAGMGPAAGGDQFTLSQGQTRFDAHGRPIASVAPEKKDDDPNDKAFNREGALRKEFEGHVEGFQAIRSAYENVQNAKPNDAGDTQLVLNFMRTISPGIRIQPGERVDDAASVPGVPSQVVGIWNKLVGGGKLNDSQRQEIRDQARTTYRTQKSLASQQRARYSNLAKLAQLDPSKVVGEEDSPVAEFDVSGRRQFDSEAEAAAAGLPNGTPIVVNGRKAKWHN